MFAVALQLNLLEMKSFRFKELLYSGDVVKIILIRKILWKAEVETERKKYDES